MTTDEINAIATRQAKAMALINDLNDQKREWYVSIPARPDHDPDLVIGHSLQDIPKLLADLKAERARSLSFAREIVKDPLRVNPGCRTCRYCQQSTHGHERPIAHADGCVVADALALISESEKAE